jgi:transposase
MLFQKLPQECYCVGRFVVLRHRCGHYGATDSAVFRAYVLRVLAPSLALGDIVIMDNLGAHKVKGICETIEAVGAALL